MKINENNWRTGRLTEGELQAFISFGAEPLATNEEIQEVYSVIVSNKDYQEISEQIFFDLNDALISINERFAHWELNDLKVKKEGSCGDCAAH